MIKFDSCPRCRGDMILNKDHYGWYERCLQCGYEHNLDSIVEAQQQVVKEEKELTWP